MAGRIQGITVEIGGDTTKLQTALKGVNTEIRNTQSQLRDVDKLLKLDPGNTELLAQKHRLLGDAVKETKEKLETFFAGQLTQEQINDLATLIYYPEAKMALIADETPDMDAWYHTALHHLVQMARFLSSKHTRMKVRSYMPKGYEEVIDELIYLCDESGSKGDHFENILKTSIQIGQAADLIQALCIVVKSLAVDQLHIVGDIFDRGPRADIVMDCLMNTHNVDIQWGNHDVLWMGAASGSRTLVATVLSNSIRYNNLDVIETGYGISLRPLSVFANEVYKHHDTSCFHVKLMGEDAEQYTEKDKICLYPSRNLRANGEEMLYN